MIDHIFTQLLDGFTEAQNGIVVTENRKNGGAIFTVKITVDISDVNKGFDH